MHLLTGSEDEDGVFSVKDVCWAGCNIQKPLPQLSNDRYVYFQYNLVHNIFKQFLCKSCFVVISVKLLFLMFYRYVVLLSGLNLASKKADHLFSLHLLLEWLSGISGTSQYQEELSKIVRVIVAGKLKVLISLQHN